MTPQLLGTLGVYASAIISTIGFIGFALLARFWTSRGGWHVFWFMAVIAAVLDLIVLRYLFGDTNWFAWLRTGVFAVGMPIVLGWRTWLIFDAQLFRRDRYPSAYAERAHPAQKEEMRRDGDRLGS